MLAALALCVALGGPTAAVPPMAAPAGIGGARQEEARIAAIATVVILEPVANAARENSPGPLRLVSQTRDGRHFIEYQ